MNCLVWVNPGFSDLKYIQDYRSIHRYLQNNICCLNKLLFLINQFPLIKGNKYSESKDYVLILDIPI